MICPKDFKPCCDDICYGSGCLRMGGMSMLERCPGGCGAMVTADGSEGGEECQCEPPDYYDPQDYYDLDPGGDARR